MKQDSNFLDRCFRVSYYIGKNPFDQTQGKSPGKAGTVMDAKMIWEIIGYCGSALVVVSLLMSSVVKLRIINTIGSLIFCVYAFVINSIPTALMNVALVIINLYFLYKLLINKKTFQIVECDLKDSSVRHILEIYEKDLSSYFGKVDLEKANVVLTVYDKDAVVGITAGIASGDTFEYLLDYTTPGYRNCAVGKLVCKWLSEKYRKLIYAGQNEKHIDYVSKLGFQQENGRYVKTTR